MSFLSVTLICAVPMGILCYALYKVASMRPDYGTDLAPEVQIDGTIVIG